MRREEAQRRKLAQKVGRREINFTPLFLPPRDRMTTMTKTTTTFPGNTNYVEKINNRMDILLITCTMYYRLAEE